MHVSKLFGMTIVLCAVVVIVGGANSGSSAQSQEVRMLETRIIQFEQRLYSIESSVNRLQQSIYSQRSTPSTNVSDPEIRLLRDQLQNLTQRVSEAECGLLKLDERTATTRRAPVPDDPCRLNPNAPVRLPTRP